MIEWIKNHFAEIIIFIATALILFGIIGSGIANEKEWNDGRCECGGRWEYCDSVTRLHKYYDSTYTETSYIYKCNDCGKMHEFAKLR